MINSRGGFRAGAGLITGEAIPYGLSQQLLGRGLKPSVFGTRNGRGFLRRLPGREESAGKFTLTIFQEVNSLNEQAGENPGATRLSGS